MTIGEIVSIFNAKRIGKGKYVAKCPAHPDKHPSLSIAEGKRGILIKCMSNGCDTRSVVETAGLRMLDLFYTSRDIDSAALREIRRQQEVDRLYALEQRIQDLKFFIKAIESPRRIVRTMTDFDWRVWLFTGGVNDRAVASKFYREQGQ